MLWTPGFFTAEQTVFGEAGKDKMRCSTLRTRIQTRPLEKMRGDAVGSGSRDYLAVFRRRSRVLAAVFIGSGSATMEGYVTFSLPFGRSTYFIENGFPLLPAR
jgi:hypothetical protein